MSKLNNKGFTLIELLTTICILSVILSITLSFGINLMKEAKEKSYKVTENNIEKAAVAYLKENDDITFIETDGTNDEYQCIQIKNLIDYGYFDTEILKSEYKANTTVSEGQFIYIVRDKNIKTIKSSKFPGEESFCKAIQTNNKNITITYKKGWAKSKEVKIIYKLNGITNINEYKYMYTVNNTNDVEDKFNSKKITKTVTINTPGSQIYSKIYNINNSDDSISEIAIIDKIDNNKPMISKLSGDEVASITKNIPVTIIDSKTDKSDASGFNSSDKSLKVKYGWSTSNKTEPSEYKEATLSYNNCSEKNPIIECKEATFNAVYDSSISGEYYLWIKPEIKDMAGNEVDEYISEGTYKVLNPNTNTPIITRIDYNTFEYTIEDKTQNVTYYVSTDETTPTSTSNWGPAGTKDITEEARYYVWTKDSSGNISEPSYIDSYTIKRNQGKGSILNTKYDSTGENNGTEFNSEIIVLEGTPIFVKATTEAGYNNLTLRYGENSVNTSEVSVTATQSLTISSAATASIYKITLIDRSTTKTLYYQYNTTKIINGVTCYYYTDEALTKCLDKGYYLGTDFPTSNPGHTFKGFFKEENGKGTQYVDSNKGFINNIYKTVGNQTLYSYWTPNIYQIKLIDEPSNTTKTLYYEYNTTKTINGVTCYYYTDEALTKCLDKGYYLGTDFPPSNTGYTFKGFFKEENGKGTQYVNSSKGFINNIYQTIGNQTLYSYWTPNIYQIKLIDEPSNTTLTLYYEYNTTKTINGVTCYYYTDNALTKCLKDGYTLSNDFPPSNSGYTFKGFFKEKEGNGTQYVRDNKSFMNNIYQKIGNHELYSYWKDETAPSPPTFIAKHKEDGTPYSGDWTNRRVVTTLTSTDEGSGISYMQYKLSDPALNDTWHTFNFGDGELTKNGTTWTGTEGWEVTNGRNQSYVFRACDKEENCSENSEVYTIKYDTTKPTVAITAKKKTSGTTVASGSWSNEGLNFILTNGVVGASGATIYYCKDTTNTCTPTTKVTSGATITTYNTITGTYYIRYKIVGGSGNESDVSSYIANIDISKPTATLTMTSTLKSASQTATLKCTDNNKITGYYFGTSSTGGTYTTTATDIAALTGNNGLTKTINEAGTYYLFCNDNANNENSANKAVYSYSINNLLEKVDGTTDTYTNTHYESKSTTGPYLAPSGITLTLTSLYTIPTGSSSSTTTFKGHSISYSTSVVTPAASNPSLNSNNMTLYMWFNRTTHTLILNKGTGISSVSGAGTYKYGKTVTISATPNQGYAFSKWSVTSGNTPSSLTSSTTPVTITQNTTLKAEDNGGNTYTITYKDCGNTTFSGTHTTGYPTTYKYAVGATLDKPTKTGYTFAGYYTASACTGTAVTNVGTTETGNKTFYAKWNQINTATFYYYNGTSVTSTTAECTGETSCTVSIPLAVRNSTGKYDGVYEGLSTSTGDMTVEVSKTATTINLSANQTYYATYRTPVTIYYPSSETVVSNTKLYRNEYLTTTSAITVKLSTSTTGTIDATTINGIYGTFNGMTSTVNSSSSYSISQRAAETSTTYYATANVSMTATIYYQSNSSAGSCSVSSTTTTSKRLYYCKTTTSTTVSNYMYNIPSSVTASIGKFNSEYKGLALDAGTLNSRTNISTADDTTTYYTVYSSPVTNYYYNNGYTSRTIYRNEWLTSTSECSTPVLSTNSSGASNYETTKGHGNSDWIGLASTSTTTPTYTSVSAAAQSTASTLYTIYQFNVTYAKGANVSAVSPQGASCKVTTSSTSCPVTLGTITPNNGYVSVGWSSTSGATSGTAAVSTYILSTNNQTLYANAKSVPLTFNSQILKSGSYNDAYSDSFTGASNGVGPYTYSITKVTLDDAAVTASSNKYNGLSVNGTTISGTPATAGTYKFVINAKDNGTGTEKSATMTISIAKDTNPIKVTAKTLTYNKEAQQLVTVSEAQGNVCYSTSSAVTSCSSAGTIPSGTNAGNYTVYWYVAGNTNYSPKSGSVTSTINKKTLAVPSQSGTLTYNAEDQQPSWNNYNTTWMTLGGTTTGTNATNYNATFTLKDTANTWWSDGTTVVKTVPWSIDKYDLSNATIKDVEQKEYEYNTVYRPEPTVTVPLSGTTTLAKGTDFNYGYSSYDKIGTATITVTATDGGNYKGTKSSTFTIADTIKPVCIFSEWLSSEIQLQEPTTINLTCTDGGSGIPETNLSSTSFDYAMPSWKGKIDFSSIVTKGTETERIYEISVTGKEAGRLMLKLIEGAIKDNAGNTNDETVTAGTIKVNEPLSCTISATPSGETINDGYSAGMTLSINSSNPNVTYSFDDSNYSSSNTKTLSDSSTGTITYTGYVKDQNNNSASCSISIKQKTFYQHNTCTKCNGYYYCSYSDYVLYGSGCYTGYVSVINSNICTSAGHYWVNGSCYTWRGDAKYMSDCSSRGCNTWNTTDTTWYETSAGNSNYSTKKDRNKITAYGIE